jgi:hypothetical protein
VVSLATTGARVAFSAAVPRNVEDTVSPAHNNALRLTCMCDTLQELHAQSLYTIALPLALQADSTEVADTMRLGRAVCQSTTDSIARVVTRCGPHV